MQGFSLKTRMAVILGFITLVGMLLIDLVITSTAQRVLVANQVSVAESAGALLRAPFFERQSAGGAFPHLEIKNIFENSQIQCMNLYRRRNDPPVQMGDCVGAEVPEAMVTPSRTRNVVYGGRSWGVFWLQPKYAVVQVPYFREDHWLGSLSILIDLTPVYQELRGTQSFIWLYVLINTVLLVFIGTNRLWRITGKPIQRLATRAEAYQPEDEHVFHLSSDEGNEMTRLSRSLNQMTSRIEEDREILRGTVASLEAANLDLKQAQQDIIRAEKLASVGRLASGIAHEIGNPIGIVSGYLELLKQNPEDVGDRSEFIQRAEVELTRISGIIRQLLDFSRPTDDSRENVSMHRLIDDVVDMLKCQPMMADIDMRIRYQAEEDQVVANSQQIRQVLINLLMNAADAIDVDTNGAGGHILLETRSNRQETSAAAAGFHIEVCDNGAGIPDDHMANIFDPFYTTKDPGKGTGLGLSVCYMIVDGLGGRIRAENRSEGGSWFTISFPLPPADAPVANGKDALTDA